MEILDDNAHKNEGLHFSHEIRNYLTETAKWGKFLSILGFIGIGLMVLGSLLISTVFSYVFAAASFPMPSFAITVIYLLVALLCFFPVYYLYNFSTKMQASLKMDDQSALTSSFQNLKSHYRFIGILMIVILSLYALLFIIGIVFGSVLSRM